MMGKDRYDLKSYRELVAPYVFSFPASPHLSSRLENKKIDSSKIVSSFKALDSSFDHVVVEGAGGVLVPINDREFLIDLAKKLGLGVLLVAENKLGGINHTLLSIEALKVRKIHILGVIFNNISDCDKRILEDNPKIVEKLSKVKVFGSLPKTKNNEDFYKNFAKIADKIYERLA